MTRRCPVERSSTELGHITVWSTCDDLLNHAALKRLEAKSYAKRNVFVRVPILLPVRQFAHDAGAKRRLVLPPENGPGLPDPFADSVPGTFEFLRQERGLFEATLVQYRHYLQRVQAYLRQVGQPLLPDLRLSVISAFISNLRADTISPTYRARLLAAKWSACCSSGAGHRMLPRFTPR